MDDNRMQTPNGLHCSFNRLLHISHMDTHSSRCSAPQAHGEANRFNLAAVPVMSE